MERKLGHFDAAIKAFALQFQRQGTLFGGIFAGIFLVLYYFYIIFQYDRDYM